MTKKRMSTKNPKSTTDTDEHLDPEQPQIYFNEFFMFAFLFKDKDINKYDAAIYALIRALNHPEHGCYASNKMMGDALGISKQYVSNCIQKLIGKGYILTNNFANENRRLLPVPPDLINSAYNDRYRPPITNVIGALIKKAKYNISFSKEKDNLGVPDGNTPNQPFFSSPKKKVKVPECPIDVLKQWNDYPHTKNHKEGTKIHQSVNRYVNQLLAGTFSKHNSIHPKFLNDAKLPRNAGQRAYSVREIKDAVRTLADMFKRGMEPADKSWLINMSLAKLFYNERSRKSQLLKCIYFEATPCGQRGPELIKANPAWIKQLKHIINEEKLDPSDRVTYRKNLILVDKYFDWIWDYLLTTNHSLKQQLPDENVFVDWYEKWLIKKRRVTPYGIGPNSIDWKLFLNWLTVECLNSQTSLIDSDHGVDYLNHSEVKNE